MVIQVKCAYCSNRRGCNKSPDSCGVVPPSAPDALERRYCMVCSASVSDSQEVCLICGTKLK